MLVTQLRRGQRISVGASALTSGRLEAFAWHPLRASSLECRTVDFTVDKEVPGMIKIPVWMGWGLVSLLPGLPDLTTLAFSGRGRRTVTHTFGYILLALGLWW